MILTVVIVLFTHNLALGVVIGIVFSALFFATKISNIKVETRKENNQYFIVFKGPIFFVSIDTMMTQIDFNVQRETIQLDFSDAHIWDDSAVDAIETIVRKLEDKHNEVYVKNLNKDSRKVVSELSQLKENQLI